MMTTYSSGNSSSIGHGASPGTSDTYALSPMAQELCDDVEGARRDEIVALFEDLAAQASHARRKPQTPAEFEVNNALMDAAALAKEIVTTYWVRHHLNP